MNRDTPNIPTYYFALQTARCNPRDSMFDLVDRKFAQICDGGIGHGPVVEGDFDAEASQLLERFRRVGVAADERTLGNLNLHHGSRRFTAVLFDGAHRRRPPRRLMPAFTLRLDLIYGKYRICRKGSVAPVK